MMKTEATKRRKVTHITMQQRLKKMEASIRRTFEQQLQSVKAYSQANLAAEAAVRLNKEHALEAKLTSVYPQKGLGSAKDRPSNCSI